MLFSSFDPAVLEKCHAYHPDHSDTQCREWNANEASLEVPASSPVKRSGTQQASVLNMQGRTSEERNPGKRRADQSSLARTLVT